jgi:hypothetical protein
VLVVANLDSARSSVSISSGDGALMPGRYAAHNLLAGPDGASLEVHNDGRIAGYVPGTLRPRECVVLDLVRR